MSQNRSLIIGCSDIPAILGICPFKTRKALLKEKLTGSTSRGNAYTQFGKDNEKRLIDADILFSDYTLKPVSANESGQHEFVSFEFDMPIMAHLDGIGIDNEGEFNIEAKTGKDLWNGVIPEWYQAQMQGQMWLSELSRTKALFGERTQDFKLGRTESGWLNYDAGFIDKIKPVIQEFIEELNKSKGETKC